jgi:hypothetical protein
MSHSELVIYYNTTIKIIKNGHKSIMEICDMFLDVERGILYLTLTKFPALCTKKFDVYIENDK